MNKEIIKLVVYTANSVDVYKIGDNLGKTVKRKIAKILDNSAELESLYVSAYELIDENGKCIVRFENGTYATWFK